MTKNIEKKEVKLNPMTSKSFALLLSVFGFSLEDRRRYVAQLNCETGLSKDFIVNLLFRLKDLMEVGFEADIVLRSARVERRIGKKEKDGSLVEEPYFPVTGTLFGHSIKGYADSSLYHSYAALSASYATFEGKATIYTNKSGVISCRDLVGEFVDNEPLY